MPTHENLHVAKFKSRAKELQKAVQAGDASALKRISPYFDRQHTDFKLTQAQLVVARERGCSSWKELIQKDDWVACSFCKKWQYEVAKVVAGPGVYVCDECVALCNEIINDAKSQPA